MFPQSQSSASQNLSLAAALPEWWPRFDDGHVLTHMYWRIDPVHDTPRGVCGAAPMPAYPAGEAQVVPELNQSSIRLREVLLGTRSGRATATATLAISHHDDAGQAGDNTGYEPHEGEVLISTDDDEPPCPAYG